MTADNEKRGAAVLVARLLWLRRLALLGMAMLSAVFWLRDRVEVHLDLPATVTRQGAALSALERRVDAVEARLSWADRRPMRCDGPAWGQGGAVAPSAPSKPVEKRGHCRPLP